MPDPIYINFGDINMWLPLYYRFNLLLSILPEMDTVFVGGKD